MAVIKSTNAPATLSPFSMADIEAQAKQILLRARQRAEQLLVEAQQQGEILKTRAHLDGQAEGRKAGLAQGLEEGRKAGEEVALNEHRGKLLELIASLSEAAKDLNGSRQRLESEATADVLNLAVAIARRVTHRQAKSDPSIVAESVSAAMKVVVHASDVRIAVHPQSRATLEAALPKLKTTWPTLEHVELTEDASLAPGGCRILTNAGEVDADLDGQIDRIAAELVPSSPP